MILTPSREYRSHGNCASSVTFKRSYKDGETWQDHLPDLSKASD